MSNIDLVSASNEDVQTINVEISNLTNSVDIEFGQNTAAAINFHNQNQNSHPYLIEKLAEKVNIEAGKGLSQNDFTNEIKSTYDNSISDMQSDIAQIQGDISDIEDSLVIATQDQALAGTDDTTIMTPLKVKQSIEDSLPQIYLKDTYENGSSGYRIWSDGYCEQWGQNDTQETLYTVTFLKEFKNTNYHISLTNYGGQVDYDWHSVTSKTATTMALSQRHSALWKVSGYLAQGQY